METWLKLNVARIRNELGELIRQIYRDDDPDFNQAELPEKDQVIYRKLGLAWSELDDVVNLL